jgi:hypothetical protein
MNYSKELAQALENLKEVSPFNVVSEKGKVFALAESYLAENDIRKFLKNIVLNEDFSVSFENGKFEIDIITSSREYVHSRLIDYCISEFAYDKEQLIDNVKDYMIESGEVLKKHSNLEIKNMLETYINPLIEYSRK